MLDINNVYQNILEELKKGHRGLVRFSPDELKFLNDSLPSVTGFELKRVLCLLEYSATASNIFEKNLLRLLNQDHTDEITIFILNCSRKHIIEARFQKGERLQYDFLEALKRLLFHSNPEIVEWVLRLIEACGGQGIYFRGDLARISPPPWKWFNAHYRAIKEIITLLENRWSQFEKS